VAFDNEVCQTVNQKMPLQIKGIEKHDLETSKPQDKRKTLITSHLANAHLACLLSTYLIIPRPNTTLRFTAIANVTIFSLSRPKRRTYKLCYINM
jgi:hypothetical protein